MKGRWDPNPTFTGLLAWKPDASPEYIEAVNQQMRDKYAAYAASLDRTHPFWHLEILAVPHPPHELAELAQQRRDKEKP